MSEPEVSKRLDVVVHKLACNFLIDQSIEQKKVTLYDDYKYVNNWCVAAELALPIKNCWLVLDFGLGVYKEARQIREYAV